jgi:PAS domain S-box-containing protein
MTVGRHGAAALARAVAHQRALDRRALELSALSRLWERVGGAASFGAALEAVLDMLASIIEYEAALIFVWDGDRERLELHASAGRPLSREESRQVGEIGRWVVREQKAYLSAEDAARRPSARLWRGSLMAAPLLLEGRSLGVLAAIAGPRVTFTREQMLTFSVVGSQAAAIYHAMQSLGRLTTATENILRSIAVGVIGVDESHRVLMWSPAAEQILGCPVARARGRNLEVVLEELARVHSSPGLTAITLLAQRAIARGVHSFGHQLNFVVDGAGVRSLSVDCAPLRTTHGEVAGAVVLVNDITERKQVEERMAQVSQLAAVGHLAANVAHEIRNPLSAIKAAAQFLQREYREDPTVHQFTGIINDETDRLTKVTTDFLLYARPSGAEPKATAVVEVLERGLRILGSDFERRGVRLDFRAAESLPLIPADAEELLQVFLNLGTNAAQAMEDGGVLTVSVGESDLARSGGGRALEVVFADTGPGVPEEYREQIFAPFFTTKTRGTGLGLSIVRKIVEGHGGEVLLDSSRARGAVFRLRLPVSAEDVRAGAQAALSPAPPGPPPDQLSLFDNAAPVRLRP